MSDVALPGSQVYAKVAAPYNDKPLSGDGTQRLPEDWRSAATCHVGPLPAPLRASCRKLLAIRASLGYRTYLPIHPS